jgi:hypothetical protein
MNRSIQTMPISPCQLIAKALAAAECIRKKVFLAELIEMKYRLSSQKEFYSLEEVCWRAKELEKER